VNKLKKGDKVIVISGKDKGKTGEILEVVPSKQKVKVEGVNAIKKHVKPTQDNDGGIKDDNALIHWSNVKLVAPGSDKSTRVGFKVVKGNKERVAKATGDTVK
jgi:large subunit ribosomal protein L24